MCTTYTGMLLGCRALPDPNPPQRWCVLVREGPLKPLLTLPALPRSAYVPLFLATTAFCFPEGYNNTGLLEELKFKVGSLCRALTANALVTA